MSVYAKIKKGVLEAIRYERGVLDTAVAVRTNRMSEAALEYARSQVKDELLRIDPTLKDDTASCWAAEVVTMIDWNNDALMHKGLRWIARDIYERVALLVQYKMPGTKTRKEASV